MEPSDSKSSVLAMEVEPVTATDSNFWKLSDHRLYATLGTRPKRSPVTDRGGTSQIYKSFWENLTRVMGRGMGEMLQTQQIQQQPTATPIIQAGCREFYSYWALAALMGYAQVYTDSGIPRIWGRFQISKECTYNRQELLEGMMYWAKTNGI